MRKLAQVMTLGRSSSANSDITDPFDTVFAVVVEECCPQIEKIINLNPKKKFNAQAIFHFSIQNN